MYQLLHVYMMDELFVVNLGRHHRKTGTLKDLLIEAAAHCERGSQEPYTGKTGRASCATRDFHDTDERYGYLSL